MEELDDVGMVDRENRHVGAAAEAALLNGTGRFAEHTPKRQRTTGRAAAGRDVSTAGTQSVKSKAGTTSRLLNCRCISNRLENACRVVWNRQDKARAEKTQPTPGIHQRRTIGHKLSGRHQIEKYVRPRLPLTVILYRRDMVRDPPKETSRCLCDTLLVANEITRMQHSIGVFGQHNCRSIGFVSSDAITHDIHRTTPS